MWRRITTVQSTLQGNIIYTDETQFLSDISVPSTIHGNEASTEPSDEINHNFDISQLITSGSHRQTLSAA